MIAVPWTDVDSKQLIKQLISVEKKTIIIRQFRDFLSSHCLKVSLLKNSYEKKINRIRYKSTLFDFSLNLCDIFYFDDNFNFNFVFEIH